MVEFLAVTKGWRKNGGVDRIQIGCLSSVFHCRLFNFFLSVRLSRLCKFCSIKNLLLHRCLCSPSTLRPPSTILPFILSRNIISYLLTDFSSPTASASSPSPPLRPDWLLCLSMSRQDQLRPVWMKNAFINRETRNNEWMKWSHLKKNWVNKM